LVENFFDNLLPDSETIRRRIQKNYAARGPSAFDLLTEIGRDCVGTIQLLPEDKKNLGWDGIMLGRSRMEKSKSI